MGYVLELELDPLTEFFDAIKAPKTRRYYEKRLEEFLDFAGANGQNLREKARDFTKRAKMEPGYADIAVNQFLHKHKERVDSGEIQASTLSIYSKPVKLFYEMNGIGEIQGVNWKKISRKFPHGRHYALDRAPTREEIRKLLDYPDDRIKPVLLTMISSGIRIGAWKELNWGHIKPEERDGAVVAAKMDVYPGSDEAYFTFISGEAYRSLEDWIRLREREGEKISEKSPLMRDLFTPLRGARGDPHLPKRLATNGVKRLIEDALTGTGIRGKLPKGKRRHEFQGAHGFRKFFKTTCTSSGMNGLMIETLMGHDKGIDESYYKPTPEQLLEGYLKALPSLTILESFGSQPTEDMKDRLKVLEEENVNLRKQVEVVKDLENELGRLTKFDEAIGPKLDEVRQSVVMLSSWLEELPGWKEFLRGNKVEGKKKLQAFLEFYNKQEEKEYARQKEVHKT